MQYIEFIFVVGMVGVNAVFAAYEIALASVSVARLQALSAEKQAGAAAALAMKDGIEKSLAVVQLGITLVGLIAGATGGASASEDIAPHLTKLGFSELAAEIAAICVVVVPLTALTIVLGELMPKLFALRNKEWVCLRLSPLMRFFSLAAWPLVWLLEFAASGLMDLLEKLWRPKPHANAKAEAAELQELRAIASMARTSRLIGDREENIILGAARLARRPLREIILPAEHIRMLRLSDSLSESLIAAHLDLHTRFPVCEKNYDPQSIVGYVSFKDIVTALKLSPREPSVRGVLRQISSLAADVPISSALEFLLKEHTHIALVRDTDQRVLGMITLEDIVEELVGDIQDEHDLLPVHVIRSGNGWIIGGGATLGKIQELTGLRLSGKLTPQDATGGGQSLSAWIIERLGSVPQGSEIVRDDQVRILVRKVRRQRVLEAAIEQVGAG
ncbi:MAG: hemolysin family protein [Pirellulales bacterium]